MVVRGVEVTPLAVGSHEQAERAHIHGGSCDVDDVVTPATVPQSTTANSAIHNPLEVGPRGSAFEDADADEEGGPRQKRRRSTAADVLGDALQNAWNTVDNVGARPDGVGNEWQVINSLQSPDWEAAHAEATLGKYGRMFLETASIIALNALLFVVYGIGWTCVNLPATNEEFEDLSTSENVYSVVRNVLLNNAIPLGTVCFCFMFVPWHNSPDRKIPWQRALKTTIAIMVWQTFTWLLWLTVGISVTAPAFVVSMIILLTSMGMALRNKAGSSKVAVATAVVAILASGIAVLMTDMALRSFEDLPRILRTFSRLVIQGAAGLSNYVGKRTHRVLPADRLVSTTCCCVCVSSTAYACSALLAIVLEPVDVLQGAAIALVGSVLWKATAERRAKFVAARGETERFHLQWTLTNQLDLFAELCAFCAVLVMVLIYGSMPASKYPIPKVSNMILVFLIIMAQQLIDYTLTNAIMRKFKRKVEPLFCYELIREWLIKAETVDRLVAFCCCGVGPLLVGAYLSAACKVSSS
eukprot:Hpha_TRINITY_DN11911_c0_g1::TRINITY_DN11911_c0_g1_i1::g.20937::m.20937